MHVPTLRGVNVRHYCKEIIDRPDSLAPVQLQRLLTVRPAFEARGEYMLFGR
jgi:hypothetical protein